ATEMQTTLHKKNAESAWKHTDREIRIGVGLHHGALMLGTVGETERMDTTVISDAVNIASRVESLTKKLGAEILLTEAVYSNLIERQKDQCRRLGPMRLKGKEANIVLYDCFAALEESTRANRLDFRTAFEEATESLEKQEFQVAGQKFKDLLRLDPSDRTVEILAARIARLQ
ncbi:MAG: hypothetical protein KDK33_20265, partial [Leptospiraceae bacterium]|nr:hypothetical protein [Leptospiraceae bacterium]